MTWRPTGLATLRKQRERWTVCIEGLVLESGTTRPRNLGTYSPRRGAQAAASEFAATGEGITDRTTVGYAATRGRRAHRG